MAGGSFRWSACRSARNGSLGDASRCWDPETRAMRARHVTGSGRRRERSSWAQQEMQLVLGWTLLGFRIQPGDGAVCFEHSPRLEAATRGEGCGGWMACNCQPRRFARRQRARGRPRRRNPRRVWIKGEDGRHGGGESGQGSQRVLRDWTVCWLGSGKNHKLWGSGDKRKGPRSKLGKVDKVRIRYEVDDNGNILADSSRGSFASLDDGADQATGWLRWGPG